MASSPVTVSSSSYEQAYELADIRRGASLRDMRVDVNVAHTNSRFTARFFVEMARVDANATHTKWGFGVAMSEITTFESRLLRLIKTHGKKQRKACAMCDTLVREVKQWRKVPCFHAIGKANMRVKCDLVLQFFHKLFRTVYAHAQWLHKCDLLRDILRMTEELCQVQYPNDRDAISVIETLKRVDPPSSAKLNASTGQAMLAEDDCSICLGPLHRNSDEHVTEKEKDPPVCGVELACGHKFHDTCICMWFHTRLNCPMCRTHARPNECE
uniref:RING-type domain-containing protein n=1 Tax=Globisporangium ultimum (strain ATCC 200006 / CBS 805.95 / DAOM BR144) TaxID=431595 RepID=K3WB91_GLOUD